MNNKRFYTIGVVVSILLIALVIYFVVAAQKKDNQIAQLNQNGEVIMSSSEDVDEGDDSISSVENFEEIATVNNNEESKSENKKSGTENKKLENEKKSNAKSENTNKTSSNEENTEKKVETATNAKTSENKKQEVKENADPVFKFPVEGEFLVDYAKDKLVYSNTLGEWITHLGVDIKADKTTVVKASAEGTVKSIKNDPRYGLTVVLEHNNGFTTVYSNLLTAEFVKVGEKVTAGQTLGTVGNTASFEILDESHLHFEILKDNEQIDPNMYLKK